MFEITQEEIKQTIKRPDKMMECKPDGVYCYVKKIRGKSELLVIAEKESEHMQDIKCFGWLQNMLYPSETSEAIILSDDFQKRGGTKPGDIPDRPPAPKGFIK